VEIKKRFLFFKEDVSAVGIAIGVTIGISVLFYRSAWACLLFPFCYWIVRRRIEKRRQKKKEREFQEHFLVGIRTLNTSLQAGMSMEMAWKEVEREMRLLYGEQSWFYQEIAEMNRLVALNMPIEKLFYKIANRVGFEDMLQFAEVFDYGKRCGGNWRKIIDCTTIRISEKNEAIQQIQVMVAEKKMEQQVANVIPLGILALLQMFSWDYMSVMYHNIVGVLCMSLVLAAYLVSLFLSEKILEIRV